MSAASTTRPVRGEPITGNAAAALGGLLASLGIAEAGTRGSVEDTVLAVLAQRGLDAEVMELRWGTLTLAAAPQTAQLLRFDADNLLAAVEEDHPGAVTGLRVQVRR